jgi:hypothetical protein
MLDSMKHGPAHNISDLLFGALSLALAGSCIFFAGFMVVRLQNMENPPVDLGLNFPGVEKPQATAEAVLVDPLATGSVGRAEAVPLPRRVVQPYTNDQPVLEYELLSVIDGIAFVEVTKPKGKEIWPVGEGSELPGAGRVDRIDKVAGRWRLAAGSVKLESTGQ